jgi:hypothetical protein
MGGDFSGTDVIAYRPRDPWALARADRRLQYLTGNLARTLECDKKIAMSANGQWYLNFDIRCVLFLGIPRQRVMS